MRRAATCRRLPRRCRTPPRCSGHWSAARPSRWRVDGRRRAVRHRFECVAGPGYRRYVLVLAVLLTALSTGLHRGLDRALVGYRTGLALLSATAVSLSPSSPPGCWSEYLNRRTRPSRSCSRRTSIRCTSGPGWERERGRSGSSPACRRPHRRTRRRRPQLSMKSRLARPGPSHIDDSSLRSGRSTAVKSASQRRRDSHRTTDSTAVPARTDRLQAVVNGERPQAVCVRPRILVGTPAALGLARRVATSSRPADRQARPWEGPMSPSSDRGTTEPVAVVAVFAVTRRIAACRRAGRCARNVGRRPQHRHADRGCCGTTALIGRCRRPKSRQRARCGASELPGNATITAMTGGIECCREPPTSADTETRRSVQVGPGTAVVERSPCECGDDPSNECRRRRDGVPPAHRCGRGDPCERCRGREPGDDHKPCGRASVDAGDEYRERRDDSSSHRQSTAGRPTTPRDGNGRATGLVAELLGEAR